MAVRNITAGCDHSTAFHIETEGDAGTRRSANELKREQRGRADWQPFISVLPSVILSVAL